MEIALNKPVIREAVIRDLSEENIKNRQAEFVISSETPDTYGTVFKISGWDLRRYRLNPVVFYQHKSNSENPDMVIGTSEVRIEGDLLIGVVTFEPEELNPVAEKVWRKIQAKSIRMASVGADPKSAHWGDDKLNEDRDLIYFDEHELLEWSIVTLGSNPDALKREAQAVEEIRKTIIKDTPEVENPSGQTKKRTVREAQLIINENLK